MLKIGAFPSERNLEKEAGDPQG